MVVDSQDEIIAQVERITASSIFASSPRLIQFLRFCVNTSLQGDAGQLKESTIGVSVFGRPPDYDPRVDPIVRVHARRLRDKLESFYETEGQDEHIRVEIRKGGYVPSFEHRNNAAGKVDVAVPVESSAAVAAVEAPPSATVSLPFVQHPVILWTVLVVAVCCVASLLVAGFHRDALAATVDAVSASPKIADEAASPSALPGTERDPSWSPDGKSFAFAWSSGPKQPAHIYKMNAGGGSPAALTAGTASEFRPVWSPDGQQLAFLRQAGDYRYKVVLLDLSTRAERVLITQSFESAHPGDVPTLDWSRDGQWIVTSEERDAEPAHLMLLSIGAGHARQITDPPNASSGDTEAHFSPDSRQIVFRRGGAGDIWVVSLSGAEALSARPLTHQP
jgi:hypothetical protein